MEVLLKGVFSDVSENLREVISEESTNYRPNEVYKKLMKVSFVRSF